MREPRVRGRRPPRLDERLWEEEPVLRELLRASESREAARESLLSYLDDLESAIRSGALDLDRIERSSALGWIGALKEMASPENEAIAGFSTIETLWRAAQGETDDLTEAYVEEFGHLFRAIGGRSGLGRGWLGRVSGEAALEYLPGTGRRAAVVRSAALDEMAEAFWNGVRRHPCGLDEDVIKTRERGRDRVLGYFGATRRDWESPRWQAGHVLKGERGARTLRDLVPLASEELAAVRLAVQYHIPWGITPYYLSLFDFDSADRRWDGQVRSQVIPPLSTVRAMVEHRSDRARTFDFMRERETSPIERVTRRYPTVAIFKVCGTCPQICVYCQRNWEIDDAMALDRVPSLVDLEPALAWFESHSGITDVLLTGGDPLVLPDRTIAGLLRRLSAMDHVRHVRIGTRIRVTMPMRVTSRLAGILESAVESGRRNVSVVTHIESAHEITPDLAAAVDRLRRRGIWVYNQQVLTVETSRRFQLAATRVALKRVGIDPYYTFYPKGKDEHREYLVPIARLAQERKEEARLLPGPFRTDEPVFNVPGLGKSHLRAGQDRELIGIRSDGRRVYLFHPWEKGIAPVAPWPYVDASIWAYLARMESIGERREDYESIWYYR